MKKTGNKLLSFLLALTMAIGLMPWLSLTVKAEPAGEGISELPAEAGTYYLTEDITIQSTWAVPGGTTILDLNGHGIRMTGESNVINVGHGAALTLNDSNPNAIHRFTVSDHLAVVDDSLTGNYETFTGGYITGGFETGYIGGSALNITKGGRATMNGGTLIGNKNSEHGGAAYCEDEQNEGGSLTIHNGSIQYNKCYYAGAAIYVRGNGTLNIDGGVISDNYSAQHNIGGVATDASAELNLSGSPTFRSNGIDISLETPVNITGKFTPKEPVIVNIYINDQSKGVFTSSWPAYMPGADPVDSFASFKNDYIVGISVGGEVLLGSPVTVEFDNNGHGTAPAAQTVADGSRLSEPAAPTEAGWTFDGWYKEETCETAWDFAADAVSGSTTLYAKWLASAGQTADSWSDIVDYANEADIITISSDISVTEDASPLIVPASKAITLNLNGNSIINSKSNSSVLINRGELIIQNGTISGSDSLGDSSAILNEGSLELDNVAFDNCRSTANGGAISSSGELVLNDVRISGCESTGSGGAVFCNGGTMYLSGHISACSARSGGAVYVESGDVELNTATLSDCKAEYGGAVYCGGGTLNLTGGTITGCSASDGGAIFCDGGKMYLSGHITTCSAKTGGAIHTASGDVELKTITLSDCNAEYGGAVYLPNDVSNITFNSTGSIFQSCKSEKSGGALYMGDGAVTLSDCNIRSCSAGAKVEADSGLRVLMSAANPSGTEGDVFAASLSDDTVSGGAIYCGGGTLNLTGGTITGCSASGSNGGGIFLKSGTVNLSGSLNISGNSTNDFYLRSGKKLTIAPEFTNTDATSVDMETPGIFTAGLANNHNALNFTSARTGFIVNRNSNGEAELKEITSYPLWVGGVQVTKKNRDDVLGTADTGAAVKFEPASAGGNPTATLTLNGANITTGYTKSLETFGIYYTGTDALNIALAGSNIIVGTEAFTDGICSSSANVTISGDGSLNTSGAYYGIATLGTLTIKGGLVTASGSIGAISGTVKNEISGFGWTDMAGVDGKSLIAVNTDPGQQLTDYKKVQFPELPEAEVITPPTARTLSYTGAEQELVNTGSAIGGTLQYALGTDDPTAPTEGWSISIPSKTDTGTYCVWYKAAGDETHLDSEPACIIVNIQKADLTLSVSIGNWEAGTEAPAPVLEGNSGNGGVTYSYAGKGSGDFTDTMPTDAGVYTLKASVAETANYNKAEATCDFTITEAVHQHTFGTNPRWLWRFVDGKVYAEAAYSCDCGETETAAANVVKGPEVNGKITYTATDKYENTDSRSFNMTFTVTYNGESTEYAYGDTCRLTAEEASDWTVTPAAGGSGVVRAEGTKTFYFPVTESVKVAANKKEEAQEQSARIGVLSYEGGQNQFIYRVFWSLPEGAQVKSTMIYRSKDNNSELDTAEKLLAVSTLRSYDMKLNVRNGEYKYKAVNLTSNTRQTVMAQVVYSLNGKTYTIHTDPVSIAIE